MIDYAKKNGSRWMNSLPLSAVNLAVAALALLCLLFSRFTMLGLLLCLVLLLLVVGDLILILRDLFTSGTRRRAIFAVLLCLPLLLLPMLMSQWEEPLFVASSGNPPTLQVRGLSGFCGLEIYSPEHDHAEWQEDELGLIWSIDHIPKHFGLEEQFAYGKIPAGFVQTSPWEGVSPPPLDPNATYQLIVGRCMGGPQYRSLRGSVVTEYKPDPGVCWGGLRVPERKEAAEVRVDCRTHQPLPMSERAKKRLKEYQENKNSVLLNRRTDNFSYSSTDDTHRKGCRW